MNTVGVKSAARSGSARTALRGFELSATLRLPQSCSNCPRASSELESTVRRGSSTASSQDSSGCTATTSTSDDHSAQSRLVQALAVAPRTSGWAPDIQRQRLSSRTTQTSSSPRQPSSTAVGDAGVVVSEPGSVPRFPRAVQNRSREAGTGKMRRPMARSCRAPRRRSDRPVMTPAASSPPIGPR